MIGLVAIICIGAMFTQEEVSEKKKVVEQIISMQKGEGNIDQEILQTVSGQIKAEEKSITVSEAFILGYTKYEEGEVEAAKEYFIEACSGKNEIIRLYASIFLSEILMQQEAYADVVTLVGETLSTLSTGTYNKEHETITNYIQSAIYLENMKSTVIASLEKILEQQYKLDAEVMCDLKNKVAVLYFYNGNYARAMERFLEVIAHSEEMENKYYGAKAQVDLGVIYGALGNYEEAKLNFKEALEIELMDLEDLAFIKTYASINLYENMLYEEDYESARAINDTVLAYAQYLPKDLYDSIMIMNDIFLCNYYIKLGDVEAGEALLKEIEGNLQAPEAYMYLSVHTNYELLKAAMAHLKDDVAEAARIYNELLQQEDMQFKKYILKQISELLNEYGYYKEANQYEQQLISYYEQEAVAVNMDYSEYALYKYEHQKRLIEEANIKLRKYIYRMICSIVALAALGAFYLKYKQLIQMNKLDGLTKVYNRRYFEEYYRRLQSKEFSFAIIIFDIDHFKDINDTFGHLVGDKVIKKVVEISKTVVGKQGKTFRYGGEEFVSIIEGGSKEEVLRIAEQIRENIEAYEWQPGINVTVSVGVAQTTYEIRDILHKADQNLYRAKTQGRNQVIYR